MEGLEGLEGLGLGSEHLHAWRPDASADYKYSNPIHSSPNHLLDWVGEEEVMEEVENSEDEIAMMGMGSTKPKKRTTKTPAVSAKRGRGRPAGSFTRSGGATFCKCPQF